jgi:preprotein translocase subunit SecA
MAIPLWRQYTRLTPEQRREILERRRRRLDEASTREEIEEAFEADARDVREKYRERNNDAPGSDEADAPADAGSGFVSPATAAAAERLGIRPDQVADARDRIAGVLEQEYNRRQQTVPASQRTPFKRPSDQALDDELARRFNR